MTRKHRGVLPQGAAVLRGGSKPRLRLRRLCGRDHGRHQGDERRACSGFGRARWPGVIRGRNPTRQRGSRHRKSGYERIRQFANPWRVYATERKKLAQALFKKHRYEGAAQILRNLPTETEERERELLGAVAEVAEAYARWDRFRHKEAVEKLKRASDRLSQSSKLLGAEEPWLKDFAAQVERSLEQLQFIQQRTRNFEPGRRDPALAADLGACAERRIESDAFDDAVARLYRAIEMLGQCEFERVFNTDPSRADPERLPESLREEYRRKYRDDQDDGRLKLPLFAVFNALAKHGKTQLSQKFQESLDELKKLLHARNESVLGHGTTPVKEATASKMLEFVRSWLPDNCPLPKFARLELG